MTNFHKALILLLLSSQIVASELPKQSQDLGYFNEIKEKYLANKEDGIHAVKRMAFAGDDRAATLYAEHLVEEYNDTGDKDKILEAYSWYKLSIERAVNVGGWMQSVAILENSVPGIKQDSKKIYLEIKNSMAARKRFDAPFNLTLNIEKKKSNIGKTTVGSRVPNDRRKFISGNARIETGGSLGSAGVVSADAVQLREDKTLPKTQILIEREYDKNENEEN